MLTVKYDNRDDVSLGDELALSLELVQVNAPTRPVVGLGVGIEYALVHRDPV
jgi:hypothetical protein